MPDPRERARTHLKEQTVSGLLWSSGASVAQQILNFAVTVVLARLLLPAEFGLVATIAVFTGFVSLFVDFGFSAALIQREDLDERHLSSAFWMNFGVGVLLGGLVAAMAPALAWFFKEPALVSLTLVLSVNFVVGSLGIVQSALLQRAMNFRRLGVLGIASTVVGGAAGVVAALGGYGVWSLVVQVIVSTGIRTTLLWATNDWRPRRLVDVQSIRQLWRYSSNLAGYNAVNYWARNGDNLLVGKFVGAAGLGIYGRAYNLMLLPIQQISSVTALVMFPALARIQSEPERVKRAYLRAVGIIALLSFPVMTGMFVVAKPFIVTLYGDRWTGAVPVLRILCVAGLMQPVAATAGWLYQSQGRTDWLFKWGLVAGGTMVCSFAIGINWGVRGVAVAYTVAIYAVLYLTFSIPGRLIGMHVHEVFGAVRGALLSAIGMALIVWVVGRSLPGGWPSFAVLFSQFGLGVLAYAALIRIFVFQPYLELRDILRGRIRGHTATSPA